MARRKSRTHFVSNVDGADIADTLAALDPARTLFIVSSKTFTTQETMTNAASARAWIAQALGEAAVGDHFAAVSTRLDKVAAFGIAPDRVFGFWDWVGGRYSMWSAIGLSLTIAIGPENFEEFLRGGYDVDEHFQSAPLADNIPVLMGLIGVWHRNIWGFAAQAVIPYDQRLARFPAYLQQLDMESNGKSVLRDGTPSPRATGPIVFGEPGTNSQHAFFQLLHQGTEIAPVDFLVAAEPTHADDDHHALLFANCLAQSEAFLRGRSEKEVRRDSARAGPERGADRRPGAAQGFFRRPAVLDLPLPGAHAAHARPHRRALRAQGLRAVGDLGHQPLRSMGRRAGQGIVQPARAAGVRRQGRPDRPRRLDGRADFRAAGRCREADYSSSPKRLATRAAMASIASCACRPVAAT